MDALIAELERATEGSRELDARIMAVTREMPSDAQKWLREWDGRIDVFEQTKVAAFHTRGAVSCYWDPPEYSTSLDAALTLVPEGWAWLVRSGDGESFANLTRGSVPVMANGRQINTDWQENPTYAPTPALALCIASLKARKDAA